MRIDNCGTQNWRIRYFDAYSLEQVNTETNYSEFGNLDLENYPVLGDGSNGYKPYCFFIAYPNDQEWSTRSMHSNFEAGYFQLLNSPSVTSSIIHNSSMIWNAFPNPTMDFFYLEYPHEYFGYTLEIKDVQGRIVKKDILTSSTQKISTPFDQGLYQVQILGLDQTFQLIIVR